MPPDRLRRDSGRLTAATAQGHGVGQSRGFSAISAPQVRIYLVSFWHASSLQVEKRYSLSKRQPDGFNLPLLDFFLPKNTVGCSLSETSRRFKASYEYTLRRNADQIVQWLDSVDCDISASCWCRDKPYRLTRCTRVLVGNLIKTLRPDIDVITDITTPAWRTPK